MGTDKALLKINDDTLLIKAVKLCTVVCSRVIISSNLADHEIEGILRIPDEMANCGPMGGIYSCLRQSETEWNFVLSVDADCIEPEFIQFLISKINGFDVIVPVHNNGKEPLIALYHKNSLEIMKKMLDSGNYKMHNLINAVHTKYVEVQYWVDKFPKIFRNLNYLEDL